MGGRRRLRAGYERRVGDRQGTGHDVPRGPAAGEGGDRRGRRRRGAWRRRRAHVGVRRGRPLRAGRPPCAGDRAQPGRQPQSPQGGAAGGARGARAAVPGARAVDRKSNTSELQSLMRISYAVFCLKKKNSKKVTESTLVVIKE